jgi:hypothetical protein
LIHNFSINQSASTLNSFNVYYHSHISYLLNIPFISLQSLNLQHFLLKQCECTVLLVTTVHCVHYLNWCINCEVELLKQMKLVSIQSKLHKWRFKLELWIKLKYCGSWLLFLFTKLLISIYFPHKLFKVAFLNHLRILIHNIKCSEYPFNYVFPCSQLFFLRWQLKFLLNSLIKFTLHNICSSVDLYFQ